MKLLCILAVLQLTAAAVVPVPLEVQQENAPHLHGENGWYVPQADGTFVWMDMEAAEAQLEAMAQEELETRAITKTPVKYYLYTAANPKKGYKLKATQKSVDGSNFNAANPTRFVIHGWTQSYTSGMNKDIRDAWLSQGDYNVIVVDWARARSLEYISSVSAVSIVGKKVAGMIDYLAKERGMSLDTLDVIGHSLGAHVAGYAGKNVKSGQIHTIVGLDPALPLFNYEKPKKRLSNTDAFYVETIQTNGGLLGFLKPVGKSAFYPNGGESQPGCTLDLTGACAHARSCTYYAEAIAENSFPSIKCEGYEAAVKNSCGNTYSPFRMAGTSNSYAVAGHFYVPVKSKAPYGMGAD